MHLANKRTLHVAIIVAVGLLVYANTLHAPFYWDDSNFTDSPLVKSLDYFIHPGQAKGFEGHGGFLSRYFGYLSFALNYRLHGLELPGYHLVNIGIHLITALLVYRLVTLTFRTPYFREGRDSGTTDARAGFIAFFTALLFVAHPVQTQAVTYIVQRFASLAALFYLLSLTNYLQARLILSGPQKRTGAALGWLAAALVSAILAVKTKEIAYTLPFAVLLFEFLLFAGKPRQVAKALAVAAVPVLALAASRISGTSLDQILVNLDRATRLQTDMSRWDYLATQFPVLLTYLRLLVLPVGQRLDYGYRIYDSFLVPKVYVSALLLCLLLGVAVILLIRSRAREEDEDLLLRVIALGIFWFFITSAIESSIIPIVDVIFEHRLYLPSLGLFLAAAACVSMLGRQNDRMPGWPELRVTAGCLAVLLMLSGATYARNRLWSDEVAFWEDNARKTPKKARVLVNLARAREKRGDAEGAEKVYTMANDLDPDQTDTLLNVGLMHVQKGRLEDALRLFQNALVMDPNLVEAHNNIGMVYGIQGRYDDALKEFLQVVKLKPGLAEPHNNIGSLYLKQKKYPEAIEEFRKCLELDPGYEKAYLNRGEVLLATGHKGEAVADFRRALAINPESVEAAQRLKLMEK